MDEAEKARLRDISEAMKRGLELGRAEAITEMAVALLTMALAKHESEDDDDRE